MSFKYVVKFQGNTETVASALEIFTEGKRNDLLRSIKGITPPRIEWNQTGDVVSQAEVSFNALLPIKPVDFDEFEKQYPSLTITLLSFDND